MMEQLLFRRLPEYAAERRNDDAIGQKDGATNFLPFLRKGSQLSNSRNAIRLSLTTYAEAPARLTAPALLALAVFARSPSRGEAGVVRLIDNRVLRPPV